ncbi:DnaJ-like protein DjlA [Saliniradius amylolyticus]|uniref:Co-chaperone protein DjlA n=1 Tax=Saliniradius amylolyticus TaxID=2183582 RepID=A0A2S2E1P2_9ALTE|nr:co-chaperone DjlA [Saliniradius amylolyticus]AWL10947.1 DnaJ-like protein DjlA [Saliniradius amylolyticus]
MPFWGKLLGTLFGFMFGRIPGAILGFIVGHLFDRGYSQDFNQMGGLGRFFGQSDDYQRQAIFFHALFSAMGHVAKADGRVTREEIDIASGLMKQMGLAGDTLKEAQQAFREGKAADFPLIDTLNEFKQSCFSRRDVLQVFLEILIQAAYADGRLDSAEQRVLEKIAQTLGFKRHEFSYLLSVYEAEQRFRSRQRGDGQRRQRQQRSSSDKQSLNDAYQILGVKPSDDMATIKKAYRKLMSEHHPDKLIAKGLPKQAIELSKNKAQDIQAAYEMIKQQR